MMTFAISVFFATLMFCAFIILKVLGVIALSWTVVLTSIFWIPAIVVCSVFSIMVLVSVLLNIYNCVFTGK